MKRRKKKEKTEELAKARKILADMREENETIAGIEKEFNDYYDALDKAQGKSEEGFN